MSACFVCVLPLNSIGFLFHKADINKTKDNYNQEQPEQSDKESNRQMKLQPGLWPVMASGQEMDRI